MYLSSLRFSSLSKASTDPKNSKVGSKVFVFDLDNTLVTPKNRVTGCPRLDQLGQRLHQTQSKVIVATGRPIETVLHFLKGPLKHFPRPWFAITLNGAVVSNVLCPKCTADKLEPMNPQWLDKLKQYPFDAKAVEKTVKSVAKQMGLEALSTAEMLGQDNNKFQTPLATWYVVDLNTDKPEDLARLNALDEKLQTALKALPFETSLKLHPNHFYATDLIEKMKMKDLAKRRHVLLHLSSPLVNKGDAFDYMAQQLGIDSKQVVVVADGDNDLELIKDDGRQIVVVPNSTPGFLAKAKALFAKGGKVLFPDEKHKDGADLVLDKVV